VTQGGRHPVALHELYPQLCSRGLPESQRNATAPAAFLSDYSAALTDPARGPTRPAGPPGRGVRAHSCCRANEFLYLD